MTIRNPIDWGTDQLRFAAHAVEEASHAVYHREEDVDSLRPSVHRIGVADVRDVLAKGFSDFAACRTDVIFLCLLYPIIGLILERFAFGYEMLPLLFPIASGFTLIGPAAALGLYEMSRRRERGAEVSWTDAFGVFHSPSFGAITVLAFTLIGLYVLWLLAADMIYQVTLGPQTPTSIPAFFEDVFTTGAGWLMIGVGTGVGFLFAVLAMAISVVAFPLLLDREVGIDTAIWTSIWAVMRNPGPMALWAVIVTAALVIGALPLFVGLMVVLPVLGHATWHLYRRLVPH
ncbi:MAG: hypothetical protein QOJ54_3123 [Aliidongia sp.]|nr:hypothetical protein [Aliidongia sp.]